MISQKVLDKATRYDLQLSKPASSTDCWEDIFTIYLDVPWWKFPKKVVIRCGCTHEYIKVGMYNVESSTEGLQLRQRLHDYFSNTSRKPAPVLNLVK